MTAKSFQDWVEEIDPIIYGAHSLVSGLIDLDRSLLVNAFTSAKDYVQLVNLLNEAESRIEQIKTRALEKQLSQFTAKERLTGKYLNVVV